MTIKITDTISLKELATKDASIIFPLIEENRQVLSQYLYWVESIHDLKTTEHYIHERINSGKPGARWFKISLSNSIVGIFGIKVVYQEQSEAEIGYWLSQRAQGNGVISNIIASIREILKSENIKHLRITCLNENKASIAVAIRAGAKHTDTVHQYMHIGGKLQDLNIYTVQL